MQITRTLQKKTCEDCKKKYEHWIKDTIYANQYDRLFKLSILIDQELCEDCRKVIRGIIEKNG